MKTNSRSHRLLPKGIPRYVRCYDNGGESIDRYTVVFTGRAAPERCPGFPTHYPYLAMNEAPFHPQGFGQHGSSKVRPCDVNRSGWPPAIGRRNHLGLRILFSALPPDCQRLVLSDYKELWKL
jgi:hypothetical protein